MSQFLPFIWLIHFILCSHVFGTVSDQSDLDNSQIGADDNDIKDEYETVRRQRADRSGYCVGTDAAILAYYLHILNTKCTLLIKLQPMFNISLES